ncbi:MAG: metal ABC transporter solute-binding protein, Zn/Mn family [Bacteroidales bacterium]
MNRINGILKKMKNTRSILLIYISLLLSLCSSPETGNHEGTISVSILPQKYFVEKIAGSDYKINVMIPPGASPATYEPTPRQISELSGSDIYFRIGKIAFEKAWMKNLQKNNPDVKFVDLSEGIDYIITNEDHGDHKHVGEDPHIWMSPLNVLKMSEKIYIELKSNFPEDSSLFRKNYVEFSKEIKEIDELYRENITILEGKNFLIYHPALGYLARDYGMIQHVLEFEGKEPPPSHIANIIKEAKENDIQYIFIQSQFNMDNAKSLSKELGAEIIMIDPLNENWKVEMLSILEKLKQ